MTKAELSTLLHELEIPVNEGITAQGNIGEYPRIVFWPYIEQDGMASGGGYYNNVTYQISFFARTPQHEKYLELRKKLRDRGIHPVFYHEYVEKDQVFARTWHTYFNLEVTEELDG